MAAPGAGLRPRPGPSAAAGRCAGSPPAAGPFAGPPSAGQATRATESTSAPEIAPAAARQDMGPDRILPVAAVAGCVLLGAGRARPATAARSDRPASTSRPARTGPAPRRPIRRLQHRHVIVPCDARPRAARILHVPAQLRPGLLLARGRSQVAYDLRRCTPRAWTAGAATIVIVDSFGSPTIRHDLRVFDQRIRPARAAVAAGDSAGGPGAALRPARPGHGGCGR